MPIPAYALYGDPAPGTFPDALHIETIAARSTIHGWRIRPHRHIDLHQVFLVRSGGGTAWIDGSRIALAPGTAIVMPPLAVHGFAFDPGTDGHVASLPGATLARALGAEPALHAALAQPRVFAAPPDLAPALARALDEFAQPAAGRAAALTAHAGLIAIAFARAATGQAPAQQAAQDAATLLVRRYLDQVEGDFRAHPTILDRARRLGVSAPHLSRACRAVLGRSAQAVVHDRLLLEARRNLVYTSMTVAQIAYGLGFNHPTYFSRFFAERVGTSPTAHRAAVFAASGTVG